MILNKKVNFLSKKNNNIVYTFKTSKSINYRLYYADIPWCTQVPKYLSDLKLYSTINFKKQEYFKVLYLTQKGSNLFVNLGMYLFDYCW